MRLYRALTPFAQDVAKFVAGLVVFALLSVFGVYHAHLAHEARTARLRVCDAELRALRASSAWAQKAFCSADPCSCVEIVARGR